jgi:hypothetical protein
MRIFLVAVLSYCIAFVTPAGAQGLDLLGGRGYLGNGRLFTNDYLGDGEDRWRTGSYAMSFMFGPDGTLDLPQKPGDLVELRYSGRLLAPANLRHAAPGDRRYAGIATLGLYTHWALENAEFSLGAEAVVSGPISGVPWIQMTLHDLIGIAGPSHETQANQIPNGLRGAVNGEVAYRFNLPNGMVLRPYMEARTGDVTLARVGADLFFGNNFSRGVLARDYSTGQLYQTLPELPPPGMSFVVGADTAKVFSSAWLPEPGYTLTPFWNRARAGMFWQGNVVGVFYGATWTGPEFTAQPEGQVLGSVTIQLSF